MNEKQRLDEAREAARRSVIFKLTQMIADGLITTEAPIVNLADKVDWRKDGF